MRSHSLSRICLVKHLYWLLQFVCLWLFPVSSLYLNESRPSESQWHFTNGTYNRGRSGPALLCWTGVTLRTMRFVSFLPTGCPTVPGPLWTPRKSIQPLRWSMIRVARRHWHSFYEAATSEAPHYMLLGLYVSHGRQPSALACVTAIMGAVKSELTLCLPLLLTLFSFSHYSTQHVPLSVAHCYYFD